MQSIVVASVPAVIAAAGTIVAAWISRRDRPPHRAQADSGAEGWGEVT